MSAGIADASRRRSSYASIVVVHERTRSAPFPTGARSQYHRRPRLPVIVFDLDLDFDLGLDVVLGLGVLLAVTATVTVAPALALHLALDHLNLARLGRLCLGARLDCFAARATSLLVVVVAQEELGRQALQRRGEHVDGGEFCHGAVAETLAEASMAIQRNQHVTRSSGADPQQVESEPRRGWMRLRGAGGMTRDSRGR